jgi:hypothetical protein
MKELREIHLLNQHFVTLIVSLSGTNNLLLSRMQNRLKKIIPNVNITWSEGNLYEYPGIYTLWSKAPYYDIVGYSHCKGVSRKKVETDFSFKAVIHPWEKVFRLFNQFPDIDRVGFLSSEQGWGWYNFWWARSSYIKGSPEPEKAMKYYYESYLGLRKKTENCTISSDGRCYGNSKNFYSLAFDTVGKSVDSMEAAKIRHVMYRRSGG